MNQLDFTTKVGWPLSADALEFMQNMMLQLQQGAVLGGSNYIINGCVDSGINTGAGWVCINGQILPLQAGVRQAYVIIQDTVTNKNYFGGAPNPYYHTKQVVFGTGAGQVAWDTFKRNDPANGVLARLDKVEKMLKPLQSYVDPTDGVTTRYGSWLFWGRPAAEIPTGWEPVPDADWKGKVPVVYDDGDVNFDTVGETGGSKTQVLTKGNLPAVNILGVHNQSSVSAGGKGMVEKSNVGDSTTGSGFDSSGSGTEMNNRDVFPFPDLGTGDPVSIVQPYKVVLFIRFVG